MDIPARRNDLTKCLRFNEAGFKTELTFSHWLERSIMKISLST
jgi:hypothetical protein